MAKKEDDEEQAYTFFIPNNFTDSGKILDGMVDLRNAIEAAVICFVLFKIEKLIFFSFFSTTVAIILMMVTIIPIGALCVIGINGDCFTVFIKTLFTYLKNKRKLRFRRIYTDAKKKQISGSGRKTTKKTTSKSATRKAK